VAAIFTSDDDWSASVMRVYERVIGELGMQLVAKESQRTGETDRSPQLTNIKRASPNALIINVLATDAPTIASQARRMGIRARFLGTAGFTNPQTWSLADPGALEGTLVAENYYSGSERPAVREFMERYRQAFGSEPAPYAAYAYDGLRLLMNAYGRAGGCNRQAIRDALASTRDFEGVLGVLTYNGSGDARKTPVILEIREGQLSLFKE
jgi:branched-chain amino acid transport system substrate-binding protein